MPSAAARQAYEDQIPPFMSVFDLDAETMADQDTVTIVDPKMVDLAPKASDLDNAGQQPTLRSNALLADPAAHKHTDSTSTQASESAESSPTTTFSTTDSSPLSDPSPSSSPDSPVHLIPLNNYPSTTFGTALSPAQTLEAPPIPIAISSELKSLSRPMTSPSPRKPRNLKGLVIQPMFASPSTSTAPSVEPASPSFIKPQIPAMKRKPSQLSLKTNSSDLLKTTLEVPKSPSMPPILQRRALKHSTSSPHMLSTLKSATFGPPGGMSFPKVLERNENGLSEVLRPMKSSMNTNFDAPIAEEDSPIKPQMANRNDYEPYPEPGNNEDLKSPGYPDGPIAIYGDDVYLYLEPTAEEAARFDVVINVAREVKNPFESQAAYRSSTVPVSSTKASSMPEDASPIPDTAITTASFATAFEFQPSDDRWVETPTTPKANPLQRPEYIHMEWDHNTDIAPDLKELCETIDARIKDGKKVLIHCQQGASRSASLIIAYGLYQNPHLSVNDAYYAAQAKSRWISPNMKLMYSLQDFQKENSKKRTPLRSGRSPTKHRMTLSADAINLATKEPRTAPLPSTEGELEKEEEATPTRPRGNSTPLRPTLSAEAASVPKNFEWRAPIEHTPQPPVPTLNFLDLPQRPKSGQARSESSGQVESWFKPPPTPGFNSHGSFGFQTMTFPSIRDSFSSTKQEEPADSPAIARLPGAFPMDDEALMSPRAETMTNNPLHEHSEVAGMRFVESPPTPVDGLFSPRVSTFPRNPFTPFGRPEQVADPRSPPTKGETPIVRSIDDIL